MMLSMDELPAVTHSIVQIRLAVWRLAVSGWFPVISLAGRGMYIHHRRNDETVTPFHVHGPRLDDVEPCGPSAAEARLSGESSQPGDPRYVGRRQAKHEGVGRPDGGGRLQLQAHRFGPHVRPNTGARRWCELRVLLLSTR